VPEEHHGPTACTAAASWPAVRPRGRGLSRPAPLPAHAWAPGHTGRSSRLASPLLGALPWEALEGRAHTTRRPRQAGHPLPDPLHRLCDMGGCGGALAGVRRQGAAARRRAAPRSPRAPWRRDHHRGPNRGEGRGAAGHQPQQGAPVLASIDQQGAVLAPGPGAPGPATARVGFPEGRPALQAGTPAGGRALRGASRPLEGGWAAAHHRKGLVPAGLLPHRTEHPRNRQAPTRGRKRLCHDALHALRRRVERTVAGEEPGKRLRRRCARIPHRHYGRKRLGDTMINRRAFCGI